MGLLDFAKYLFNEIPIDYQGPETGYYLVPNYSQFTYSSVRGDFRLLPLADGCFAACWQDFIQVRDAGGRPLWRANDTGHTVAASPDGRQLLAFGADTRLLTRFDARTGQVLASAPLPELPAATGNDEDDTDTVPGWSEQFIWLPDGGPVAVLLRAGVGLLAPGGARWQAYYHGFMPPQEYPTNLVGLVWQPARPLELLVQGDGHTVVLDLGSGRVLRQAAHEASGLLPGPRGRQPLLYHYNPEGFVLLDPATLAVAKRYPFAGLEGVQTEAESQHRQSSTRWEKRAVLSPSGKYLLAADHSGLVWLFDAQSGYQLRIFRRELINHAYDLLWLDEKQFLALTNRGHVVKIDITQLDGIFDIPDFTPADDARHLPDGGGEASMRIASTDEQVLAALDTLATTPDAAAYAAAWEVIHLASKKLNWQAHLTPARLDGAMRRYTWMLPGTGFAGLALFAEMRQALLAVQYHLPTAPVAPVLALHDSVFGPQVTFQTLETESSREEIGGQLQSAYQQLRWALTDAQAEDVETGAPFILSDHFAQYERRCEATDAFLDLTTGGYSWEAHNVLERAFPQLAGYYAQRLATYPAPVQRQLLGPVRWHDDPTAQALLRQLAATSPHPDIRAFARQALSEAGA
ncbi:hypothetical protein GCM10027422_27460 [Hymenobacter arcticus]